MSMVCELSKCLTNSLYKSGSIEATRMLATYDGVIAIQAELARISVPLGAYPDGWGTFGNGPSGQPSYE
jgi:hypothetical protein